jgi:nicotinamidase-related amidase
MASNLGFDTTVVSDACASFDFLDGDGATMHRVGLAEDAQGEGDFRPRSGG